MSYGKVDFVDLLAYPSFLIGTLASFGYLPPIAGFDLQSALLTLPGPTPIDVGTFLSLIALAVVIGTNRPQLGVKGGIQLWIVIATVGLILGPPFIPLLDAILQSNAASIVAILVQTAGYMSASWLG